MLNTILHNFKDAVTKAVVHSGFDSEGASIVHFVDPTSEGESLVSEGINIALFGSTAAREIRGETSFGIPNRDSNTGIQQKPDLKVSLDVVILFNFKKYGLALDCYEQVLSYFYNNDLLQSAFNGFDNEVQVLLEGFNDRNEIELWNTFSAPGIPLLRYDLKYALVSGSMVQLPVIKEISAKTDSINTSNVSILIMSLAYKPAQEILAKVTVATNLFCAVNPNSEGADVIMAELQSKLIESYGTAVGEPDALEPTGVQKLKKDLTDFGLLEYIPSIDYLIALIGTYLKDVETSESPSVANFDELCTEFKSKISGSKSMGQLYLASLDLSASTIEIISRIKEKIDAFNVTGSSVYKKEDTVTTVRSELSTLQLRKKWWDIETVMNMMKVQYGIELDNALFAPAVLEEDYEAFKTLLEDCQNQLIVALNAFAELNKEYNSGELVEISTEVKMEYLNAYINCDEAINYINSGSVPDSLSQGLQLILIEQNK
jgi:hypothetical protein